MPLRKHYKSSIVLLKVEFMMSIALVWKGHVALLIQCLIALGTLFRFSLWENIQGFPVEFNEPADVQYVRTLTATISE